MNCEHCRIGNLQTSKVPYIQMLDGQIVVIPEVPATSCDICGHMEYDGIYIQNLEILLDKLSNNPPVNELVTQRKVIIDSPPWPATSKSQ